MSFENLMSQLDRFARMVKGAIITLAVVEALLVILIGVVTDSLRDTTNHFVPFYVWSLVFLGGLYLTLLLVRVAYDKSFPGSIANELRSERELTKLRRESQRQATTSQFLVEVIERLNEQTCALNGGSDETLCDRGIVEGLSELLGPVISNVNFLLDTQRPDALVGVYLKWYASVNNPHEGDTGVLVLNDTLPMPGIIQKNLYDNGEVSDLPLEIQSALKRSFRNQEFLSMGIGRFGDHDLAIHCSPMPVACNGDNMLGVLFFIAEEQETIPADLHEQMTIFNRVVANWVYRYDDCVSKRHGGGLR